MPQHKFDTHIGGGVQTKKGQQDGGSGQTLYFRARSVDEVLELLAQYGKDARMVAGGLDVVGLLKNRIISPRALINIKPVDKLKYLAAGEEGVAIGALTRLAELDNSGLIAHKFPVLARAAGLVGSPQVRNMASLAGNLCQQTRCWYYRRNPDTGQEFSCQRKGGGDVCPARSGENQYHAVSAQGACVSSFPSDMAVVLAAHNAKLRIVGPEGMRLTPVGRFYTDSGPLLESDELITGVFVPKSREGARHNFIKFRIRQAIDFALVSVAVSFRMDKGSVKEPRIFLGGVAPAPLRARQAEKALDGARLTQAAAQKAGQLTAQGCTPLAHNAYKVSLIQVLVKRALLECL